MRNVDWRFSLNRFLAEYKNEDWFEGAIVCGSYVTGNNNDYSDIDVHIIMSNNVTWRERGNKEVDGYLIEYFMNPISKYEEYFERDFKDSCVVSTSMFKNGTIVLDKNGLVKELKDKAEEIFNRELEPLSDFKVNDSKYHIWDYYDELISAYNERRIGFKFIYVKLFNMLCDFYMTYNKIPSWNFVKFDKLLLYDEYRKRYGIKKDIPIEAMNKMKKCLYFGFNKKMFKNITDLYNYVINNCGGFDIKNYKLRSELE